MRWSASATADRRPGRPAVSRAGDTAAGAGQQVGRRRRRSCGPPDRQPSDDGRHDRPASSERNTPPPLVPASRRSPSRHGEGVDRPVDRRDLATSRCRPTPTRCPRARWRRARRRRAVTRRNTVPRGPSTAGTHSRSPAHDDAGVGAGDDGAFRARARRRTSTPSGPSRSHVTPSSSDRSTPARPAAASTAPSASGANALTFAPARSVGTTAHAAPRRHGRCRGRMSRRAAPRRTSRARRRSAAARRRSPGPRTTLARRPASRSRDHLPTPRCHPTCLFSMLNSRPVGGPR